MDGKSVAIVLGMGIGVGLLTLASKARAAIAPGPAPNESLGYGFGLVPRGSVSSPFGPRGAEGVHMGVDISASQGSPVRAALPGTIVDVSADGSRSGYGNVVIVEHAPKLLTLYAHLQNFAPGVVVGARVERGTVIGYVGATHAPNTSEMRPHLHFEVHVSQSHTPEGRLIVNPDTPRRVDPLPWMQNNRVPLHD